MTLLTVLFLLGGHTTYAAQGLNPIPQEQKIEEGSSVVVTNMPRIRSQDSIGLCYSFTAATMFDYARCIDKKIDDCTSVSDTQKASVLDVTRFANDLEALPENKDKNIDTTDRFNYEGLPSGGDQAFTMQNMLRAGAVVKESCAPFDQLVNKNDSLKKAQELELAMWKELRNSFEKYRQMKERCASCAQAFATSSGKDFESKFSIKTKNQDVLEAFTADTFEKFLDKLLIPDECWDFKNQISLRGDWNIDVFPRAKGTYSNYESSLQKIKELLAKKRPLALGFCAQTELKATTAKNCTDENGNGMGHSVIITGYARFCDKNKNCKDALKVQNSWGQSWQDQNHDGWVDAKELLDRSFYNAQSLSWLDKKE